MGLLGCLSSVTYRSKKENHLLSPRYTTARTHFHGIRCSTADLKSNAISCAYKFDQQLLPHRSTKYLQLSPTIRIYNPLALALNHAIYNVAISEYQVWVSGGGLTVRHFPDRQRPPHAVSSRSRRWLLQNRVHWTAGHLRVILINHVQNVLPVVVTWATTISSGPGLPQWQLMAMWSIITYTDIQLYSPGCHDLANRFEV